MDDYAQQLRALLSGHPTLSLREISRRSGVSRNTMSLWLKGQGQPTLATLREVLATVGMDAELVIRESCDPHAATAARAMLGDDVAVGEKAEAWMRRFQRWDLEEDALIVEAARAANFCARPGTLFFLPAPAITIASAADSLGQKWALSGENIVWCEDPRAAANLLPARFREVDSPVHGGVIVAHAQGTDLVGATRDNAGLNRVSEVQHRIDLATLALEFGGEPSC